MYYPRKYLNQVLRQEFKEAGLSIGRIGWSDKKRTISVPVVGEEDRIRIPYPEHEPTPSLLRTGAIRAIRLILRRR